MPVKRKSKDPSDAMPAPDFEQSLRELEALVERMEQGDLPLEDALRTFERGVVLTRECQTALKVAQARVDLLTQRQGEVAIEAFEDSDNHDDAPTFRRD